MNRLAQVIAAQIRREGPLPFARFMEVALYSPDEGFYERQAAVIGRAGDFFTNVSVGSLFGELLARRFTTWVAPLPGHRVQLVEAGAHDGQLAADILAFLGHTTPDLFARLEYWLLEPSAERRSWQRQKLAPFAAKLRWATHGGDLPESGVNGIIFSNEFLDALPVHRLGWNASSRAWFEWAVGLHQDRFVWERIPVRDTATLNQQLITAGLDWPPEVLAVLPDEFTIELCPQAATWWQQAASALRSGHLLTIDYGATAQDLFPPERPQGTLRAFRDHRLAADLLADPGQQDLTASVNFTALQRLGEAAGLRTEGFLPQSLFLTHIARELWEEDSAHPAWTPAELRQFKTLTHPAHLGRAFKVFIQCRTS